MLKTNDNPALTLDANGKVYLYGSHLSCGCVPRFTVRLDRRVDGAALEKAAGETLGRFPQMAVGLEMCIRDRENFDPNLSAPLDVSCHGDTGRLDLV